MGARGRCYEQLVYWFVLFVTMPSHACASCAQVEPDTPQPRVLAVVIGVSNYAGEELGGESPIAVCGDNAREIASAIRSTYPGADIELFTSDSEDLDRIPSFANIRVYLNTQIPTLPPCSYVILYFAGHGVRVGDPGRVGQTELGLVLEGGRASSEDPDLAHTLLYSELLAPFKRMRMGNFLLLLDCCYSGLEVGPQSVASSFEHRLLNLRGVAISASTRSQKTFRDAFTKALSQYWSESQVPCQTPVGMRDAVYAKLRSVVANMLGLNTPVDGDTLRPNLILGRGVQVCVGTFGKPSTLLFIYPPQSRSRPILQIGDSDEIEYDPKLDTETPASQYYIHQVPREPVLVTCKIDGATRSVGLEDTDLDREILWIDFRKPEGRELEGNIESAALRREISDVAWALGARDQSAYDLELSYLVDASDQDLLSRVSRVYDDPRSRLISQRGTEIDITEVAARGDVLSVASVLSRLDRPRESLRLAIESNLYNRRSNMTEVMAKHEYTYLRLSGLRSEASALVSGATSSDLKQYLQLAEELTDKELLESVQSLPVTSSEE